MVTEKGRLAEKKKAEWFAVEIVTPITISWHDSEVVRLSSVFIFDLEHCFLSGAIILHYCVLQFKPLCASLKWLVARILYLTKTRPFVVPHICVVSFKQDYTYLINLKNYTNFQVWGASWSRGQSGQCDVQRWLTINRKLICNYIENWCIIYWSIKLYFKQKGQT